LTKFQADAVEGGITRGTSQILLTRDYEEAYTIAEISILNKVASNFRARVLVICPNPHLAEVSHSSINQKCSRLGIETTAITRRRVATDPELKIGRVVVSTFRALTIALRTHPEILEDLECVVTERLDFIGHQGVGAYLESALVTLKGHSDNLQYISICPPVANLDELSSWLMSEVVEDKKDDINRIFSVRAFENVNESLADLAEYTQAKRGQVMILCANEMDSEVLASTLAGLQKDDDSGTLDFNLTLGHQDELIELSEQVSNLYPECDTSALLGQMLSRGVAFFHSGVSKAQRRIISNAWEDGLLPVLVVPTRFAIPGNLKASSVFVMGVYMEDVRKGENDDERLSLLSEWELTDVLQSAGRSGIDNRAFGIVVVADENERQRVISKYFEREDDSSINPRLGEVDSCMDNPENIQDLVLGQICSLETSDEDPFSILNRTFWAASNAADSITEAGEATPKVRTKNLISMRATKSIITRASEITDSSVKLVSVNPKKVEGLIHSASRDLWHHVILRAQEGVSCTCESWKYQGIRKHRLCKHLVKFMNYSVEKDDISQYASALIDQSLRGLEILDDLENGGLVYSKGKAHECSDTGKSVTMLGIPVSVAKRVMKELSKQDAELRSILLEVAAARTSVPRKVWKRILEATVPGVKGDIELCDDDIPGVVENCLEEIHYLNTILEGLVDKKRKSLRKEIDYMEKRLRYLLGGFS
jgi:superfamily II helicase